MEENALITLIKKKKELLGLADSIVRGRLANYMEKHGLLAGNINDKNAKIIITAVRSELRTLSGQYQKGIKNRKDFLREGKIEELLKTNTSTEERIEFYPFLKKKILSLKISSILDLGCGLNPIALASKDIDYYASDIKEDELNLISLFFSKNHISGKSFFYDLAKISSDLPKTDLCIIFKVLDLLDNRRELSEKILLTVPCRYFIISFSTKKLSGKNMNHPERMWFEKILSKNNLKFERFSSENEVFYLIKKSLNLFGTHQEQCSWVPSRM